MRVGVLGFGHLGQYLCEKIEKESDWDVAFVWNRTQSAVASCKYPVVASLEEAIEKIASGSLAVDVVIEVAHPDVSAKHAAKFLEHCSFICGSPTCFSDSALLASLTPFLSTRGLIVPSGALWGASDIKRMASVGALTALTVTMAKHPDSIRSPHGRDDIAARLKESQGQDGPVTVFEGSVAEISPLFPNNVNTMACAALAASPALDFHTVRARLVADRNLNAHVTEIEARGKGGFNVKTVRENPAATGAVTGNVTFESFWGSLLLAKNVHRGLHIL